ncbi:MAG: hypothetical protein ABFD89_13315 [Bryobacteraceae bacterium]
MPRYEDLQNMHFVKGIDPVADAFAGTVATDIVDVSAHGAALFLIYKGVGATGTSTITVEACSDVTPTNSTAVPFYYKAITSNDTQGSMTAATSAGFATTAGSSQMYAVMVDAQELADAGYKYVRLKAVEVVDSPVLGGIAIALVQPRFGGSATNSVID